MSENSNINQTLLEKNDLKSVWPGKNNFYSCVVLNPDNTKKVVDIPKAECEIMMYLLSISSKITPAELAKMKQLIIAYGEEKYEEAETLRSFDDAGSSL